MSFPIVLTLCPSGVMVYTFGKGTREYGFWPPGQSTPKVREQARIMDVLWKRSTDLYLAMQLPLDVEDFLADRSRRRDSDLTSIISQLPFPMRAVKKLILAKHWFGEGYSKRLNYLIAMSSTAEMAWSDAFPADANLWGQFESSWGCPLLAAGNDILLTSEPGCIEEYVIRIYGDLGLFQELKLEPPIREDDRTVRLRGHFLDMHRFSVT